LIELFQKTSKIFASSVDKYAQKIKVLMERHDAQYKVAPANKSKYSSAMTEFEEAVLKLVKQGYTVSKIMCGECNQDDLLVQLHSCIPFEHQYCKENKINS